MKKILLGILALTVVVCACFALVACGDKTADVLSEEGSALEYEQVEDGYRVVGLAEGCSDTKLVIPSGHNGKPVTEIGDSAFLYNDTITEVVFPTTLKRIDAQAFARCINLQSVSLPDGLEELGDAAFNSCEALRTVHISGTVKRIGLSVFAYDSALESVTADKGLKCLGDYMFDIVIPDRVLHIGNMAFAQNVEDPHIKTIAFGKELVSIGAYAFGYTAIDSLELPEKLLDMGIQAFMGCKSLRYAKVSAHQTYIPYGAFAACTALEWVMVQPIEDVVDTAFGACENLKYVYYLGTDEEFEHNSNVTMEYRVGVESNDNEANGYGNKYYVEAELFIYSEEPDPDGHHWHYNADGMPEVWTYTAAE